jgi:hypothetical protein
MVSFFDWMSKRMDETPPLIVSQLIAKMLLDEPSLILYDAHDNHFNIDAFPSNMESFDLAFAPSTQRGSLRCYFSVRTTRSFHWLKVGVWDLLQRHNIFLDRSPGPTSKRNLIAMGFWLHIHPGFASPRAFGAQITDELQTQYNQPTVLAECGLLAEFAPPVNCFCPPSATTNLMTRGLLPMLCVCTPTPTTLTTLPA